MMDSPNGIAQESSLRGLRVLLAVIAVLCVAGIGVSIELTRIHVKIHSDPNFQSVCAVSEGVNCETVALSPYSVFAGLPISVWGLLGYAIMGLLALWGVSGLRLHRTWPLGALLVMSVCSLGASAVLAFVSVTCIASLCLFCIASYAFVVALVVLVISALRTARCGPLRAVVTDLREIARRPLVLLLSLVACAVPVAVSEIMVEPYWESIGWSDLPALPNGIDERGHHWIGATSPLVTVVEFSDYECPHCRKAHKQVRQLAARYRDQVRLVHRHLPLDKACHPGMRRELHQRACEFARAAECAGEQDRFWEMNDALFSIQDEIKAKDVDLGVFAVRVGVDRPAFDECLAGERSAKTVQRDLAEAIERHVRRTPSFFIDGKKQQGMITESTLKQALASVRGKAPH